MTSRISNYRVANTWFVWSVDWDPQYKYHTYLTNARWDTGIADGYSTIESADKTSWRGCDVIG